MAPTDDPIRDEVERALHALAGAAFAGPLAVRRCARRRLSRARAHVGRPVAVLRSVLDLLGRPATTPPSVRERLVDPGVDVGAPTGVVSAAPTGALLGPPADLPIDEYESLAASQVVARLPALTPDELDEVRRFETAHRGRRTVLGRIDQLLPTT